MVKLTLSQLAERRAESPYSYSDTFFVPELTGCVRVRVPVEASPWP